MGGCSTRSRGIQRWGREDKRRGETTLRAVCCMLCVVCCVLCAVCCAQWFCTMRVLTTGVTLCLPKVTKLILIERDVELVAWLMPRLRRILNPWLLTSLEVRQSNLSVKHHIIHPLYTLYTPSLPYLHTPMHTRYTCIYNHIYHGTHHVTHL